MKKKIGSAVILFVLLILFFFFISEMGVTPENNNPVIDYLNKNFQAASSFDREIVIYGKVIDGKTQEPLENVELETVYHHASMIPPYFKGSTKKIIKTDKNGLFLVNKIYGDALELRGINKEGYWTRNQNYAFPQVDVVTYKPDKENPIVFKMYKEVKDNYLLSWNGGNFASSMKVNEGDEAKSCFYSVVKRYADSYENLTKYNSKFDPSKFDFQFIVEKIKKKPILSLMLSMKIAAFS